MPDRNRPGIHDAIFGDLDDDTRARYGLTTTGPDTSGHDRVPSSQVGSIRSLGGKDVLAVARDTMKKVSADRVTAVAGGVTFFGLLSLFPAITAFVSIYGLVADPAIIAEHLSLLEKFVPAGTLDIIRAQVESIANSPGSALSAAGVIGLLVAFYSANGGMKAMLSALNVALMQNESRGFLRLNLVAMGFTLSALAILALMLTVVAVVPILLAWLPMQDGRDLWLPAIRWPAMFAVLTLALAGLYRWGPSVPNPRWRWISPGAVFAAVALVVVSMGFSWYAANFANYNKTYGSLGAVIGLMMWLWLSSTVILVGAELNSALDRRIKAKVGTAPGQSG
ncbi:YihY/virulence factor BrkB family protein [Paracoccus sp. Z330]|uniref:YihY/virulence factor BrkB family protein n=1 Tax=Paracoccus onchidii TaxID=3017813 RepID=A0ABT4ZDD0_9RHOB|nr:YihY/virulence factor BrkB family protein [Paracoccus onchidii]MDB6176978.1 YihY/virulence factor BrkB family protein [Paracoccus onchidii]